jgi:hypothetical protein
MPSANGQHNFQRTYFKSVSASSDVRAHYEDLYFNSTGGGETIRARGIANSLLSATGATINAIHATGRVAAGKTVSGALNGIRATLEVAGTTPTPGGTLAALQVDSNIVTGATMGGQDAFIRFTNTGAGKLINLFAVPTAAAKTAAGTDPFVARHADCTATHGLRIVDAAGTPYWIMVTTDTPGD